MATYETRAGANPVKAPRGPRRPRPIEPVGGGQVGVLTGTGNGLSR